MWYIFRNTVMKSNDTTTIESSYTDIHIYPDSTVAHTITMWHDGPVVTSDKDLWPKCHPQQEKLSMRISGDDTMEGRK